MEKWELRRRISSDEREVAAFREMGRERK
jgi:hypothetical protein